MTQPILKWEMPDESLSRKIPISKTAPLSMEEMGRTCLPKLLSLRTNEVMGDKLHPVFAINQGLGSLWVTPRVP